MSSDVLRTDKSPSPGGSYSQGRKAGGFVFVSQQDPIDPVTRKVPGPTLADQVPRVVDNIRQILAAGGATLDDVVQMNVYLASTDLFPEFSRIFGVLLKAPYPARCTIQVGRPWGPDRLLEMDAIAYVGDEGGGKKSGAAPGLRAGLLLLLNSLDDAGPFLERGRFV